jgi:hypothetical protein
MKSGKLHSSWPYFFLVALFGIIPVLNNKYPAQYFPDLSPWWIEVFSTFAGIAAATLGFMRQWARLEKQAKAKNLVMEAVGARRPVEHPSENDVDGAGRFVSRLVRNVEEDLREIVPDFSKDSLRRLGRFLPKLLGEIEREEDALIRVGVTGVYLGEAACRNDQWQWRFNADPAMRQFSYLSSNVQKKDKNLDPFLWAARLMAGKGKMSEFIKEIESR